jgi:O-antigen ligase
MGFLLTLVYVAGTYLRPAEAFPALAPYRVMLLLGLAAAAGGVWASLRGRGPTFRGPQIYLVPLFAAWAVFTVMAQGWLGGALPAAEELSGTILIFLAVTLAVTSLTRVRILAGTMVVLTVVVVGQGVAALFWGYHRDLFVMEEEVVADPSREEEPAPAATDAEGGEPADADSPRQLLPRIRSRGVLNDPNDLGQATVAVLPLLFAFWRRDRLARSLAAVGLPSLFLLYGVYLTRSRGAFFSLLAVAVVAGWRRLGRVAGMAVALAGVAALALVGFAGRAVALDESAMGRTEAWADGLLMLRSSPIWGVGYGNFTEHHSLVAHNSFVHCFAEVGLVGYFLWLAILAVTYRQISVAARPSTAGEPGGAPDGELGHWASAVRLSLTAFLVAAFFLSRTYNVLLFLIVGLATAVIDLARRGERLPAGLPVAGWLAAVASLEAASVVFFAVVVRLSRLAA